MVKDERTLEDADSRSAIAWAYPSGQVELGLLHQLVREGRAAAPNVHYAANIGALQTEAWFRPQEGHNRVEEYVFRSTGVMEAFDHRGQKLPCRVDRDGAVHIDSTTPVAMVRVTTSDDDTPAGFLPVVPAIESMAWEVRLPSADWRAVRWRVGAVEAPPHCLPDGIVEVFGVERDGMYEFSTPHLGRLVVSADTAPTVVVGESVAETFASDADSECPVEMVENEPGIWSSRFETGFRYVRATGTTPITSVSVRARIHPVPIRGAFTCSDQRLNDIWLTAARTLHLCMRGLVLDGIKRDRMPWIGDQALATTVNAYTVGDPQIVRDGIVALGQVHEGYINGISDYSLWWVITARTFVRYFDAGDFLTTEGPRIETIINSLAPHAAEDGVLRPPLLPHTFVRVFIDWGVETDEGRDSTALQMLWLWALDSAIDLLPTAPGRTGWIDLRDRLLSAVRTRAWNAAKGVWNEYLDGAESVTPYANFFAVLNGLSAGDAPGIRALLELSKQVGTPFMTSFLLRGLAQTGNPQLAVQHIRELWGSMLDDGARTFWEEFPEPGRSPYEMYGRPFGKSLCHGWSAGPAAMLPELILGLRPLGDNWSRFEVDPHLGPLHWAEASVPTSHGVILVRAESSGATLIEIPSGTSLTFPTHDIPGPARYEIPARAK
jgi:alpha-L-rhamnosidase